MSQGSEPPFPFGAMPPLLGRGPFASGPFAGGPFFQGPFGPAGQIPPGTGDPVALGRMGLDAQRAAWEQYLGHLEQNRDELQDYDNPGMKLFLDWSMQWAAFQAETQRAFNRMQIEMVKGYLSYLENLGRELERAPSPGSTPAPPDATAPADGATTRGADADSAASRPATKPPDAAPPPGAHRPAPDDGAT